MHALGLDVGGTKISGAIVNAATGEMLDRQLLPTQPERDGAEVLDDLTRLHTRLRRLAERRHLATIATGIGVAELVDKDGIVRSGHTIAWNGVDLAAALDEPCVTVMSDVIAGSIAEARLGAGHSAHSFLYVSVGTGLSSAFVIDGTPWLGANGNAIILASGPLSYPSGHAPWLSEFVPEQIASGSGLVRLFAERSQNGTKDGPTITVEAAAGNPAAIEAITIAARMLASVVGFAINVLDPHRVVVGGGLGTSGGLYWDTFHESLPNHIWAAATRTIDVVTARFDEHAGTVGAAIAAAERFCA